MDGEEVKAVVPAVRISPKMAFPLMVILPVNVALSVIMGVAVLTGEAKCVVVSGLYASKLY